MYLRLLSHRRMVSPPLLIGPLTIAYSVPATYPTVCTALNQYKKSGCRSMFAECTVDLPTLASRIFFSRPAVYLTQVTITQQWADMDFPNRSLKKFSKPSAVAAFEVSNRNNAAQRQNAAPAVYVLDTVDHVLLKEDKQYFLTLRAHQ